MNKQNILDEYAGYDHRKNLRLDHYIFTDLYNQLEKLSIFPTRITALGKLDNRILGIDGKLSSQLTIFVSDKSFLKEYKIKKFDPEIEIPEILKNKVKQIWTKLCKKYDLSNNYATSNININFYNYEQVLLTQLIYSKKDKIVKYFRKGVLKRTINKNVEPKYVFVCSAPGVNVIYGKKSILEIEKRKGSIERHRNNIIKLLMKYDEYNCVDEKIVHIDFYDMESDADVIRGFYRED